MLKKSLGLALAALFLASVPLSARASYTEAANWPLGEALGAVGYRVKTKAELIAALEDSKAQSRSTVIDMKVLPKTMTDGYGGWWHCGLAAVNVSEKGAAAYADKEENLHNSRRY